MTKEDVKELLAKHPVIDVEFEYNTLTLVLQGGNELVIESECTTFDESLLTISHIVMERRLAGSVELG
ncbi:hypothetical protein [Bacillus amyloliquefaciens]|uniref:hypothetical protein n=1 Tax=Bacillus amyloliquefaciens TaxID=1390 RepID=UPI0005EEE757|nr:hypothetical protein [Bacillus amyloliquefaciens]